MYDFVKLHAAEFMRDRGLSGTGLLALCWTFAR
jgi:hypothetical protein